MPPQTHSSTLFTYRHTVQFSETDMAGIVHFSNYFKWMESAEHALLKHLGLQLFIQQEEAFYGWPRVRASCAYHAPLRFEDNLEVTVYIQDLLPRAVRYKFVFYKLSSNDSSCDATKTKVATGELSTVYSEFSIKEKRLQASSLGREDLEKLEAYAKLCKSLET